MAEDLAQKILTLRGDVERARKLRADAEANQAMVQQRLGEIEQELISLGIKPDQAEQELEALTQQLTATVTDLQTRILAELAQCETSLTAAKAALSAR